MVYVALPPTVNGRTGTIDTSQFGQTGSTSTNPEFLKLYLAQLENQSFNTLFGEDGMNNSIFGDSNSFGAMPSSTSSLFGGFDQPAIPSDIAGGIPSNGGTQYMELIARSNLVGKVVEVFNAQTGETFTGTVKSVLVENGRLLIDVDGKKVPPEYLVKVTS